MQSKSPSLHGNPDSKANIFIEKFKLVHQRTARHKLFAAPAITTNQSNSTTYSLKAVEHLLGSSSKENNVIILGMLTQLKEVSKDNNVVINLKKINVLM